MSHFGNIYHNYEYTTMNKNEKNPSLNIRVFFFSFFFLLWQKWVAAWVDMVVDRHPSLHTLVLKSITSIKNQQSCWAGGCVRV